MTMDHQYYERLLEDYADCELSPLLAPSFEQHLASCQKCQDQLRATRVTQGIVRASKLESPPFPLPGFSRNLLQNLERRQDSFAYWRPLRLVALKFIPITAIAALLITWFAYSEISSNLGAQNPNSDLIMGGSLSIPADWGREVAVFSEQISHDQEKVFNALLEGQGPSPSGKEGSK